MWVGGCIKLINHSQHCIGLHFSENDPNVLKLPDLFQNFPWLKASKVMFLSIHILLTYLAEVVKNLKNFEANFGKICFLNFYKQNFQIYFKYELLIIWGSFWGSACLLMIYDDTVHIDIGSNTVQAWYLYCFSWRWIFCR